MLPRMAPSDEAGQNLSPHHAPPVAQPDFPERQRTNDQRRRLRPGVAPARNDERHEQREHDRLRDLRFERAHRGCRQHLPRNSAVSQPARF